MKNLLKKKGFTLVEVLIVVVIIGILAALIIPRLITQPEKAYLAEAKQMLGVMRRAQITAKDSSTPAAYVSVVSNASANWSALGMAQPAETNFRYRCDDATSPTKCNAERSSNAANFVSINLDSGAITCGGTLETAANSTICIA